MKVSVELFAIRSFTKLLPVIAADLEDPINDLDQDFLESPVSDGTIEENFEAELVNAPKVSMFFVFSTTNCDT